MFINQILEGLKSLSKPQVQFLTVLFKTIFICQSQINFSSLARHSGLSERTFRRNFRKDVDFIGINEAIIEKARSCVKAFAMDAAFIKKSGKQTYGLDKFWNGCAARSERGLEASIISLVDFEENASFALTVDQTEPNLSGKETDEATQTRIDFYGDQLEQAAEVIKNHTLIGLFDGFYAKKKLVDRVCQLGFVMISRLRSDARTQYLYEGKRSGQRGRPRKYDGQVDYEELSRFAGQVVESGGGQIELFSRVVWSMSLKRKIKLVVVKDKKRQVNLFSTDLLMEAEEVFRLYRLRFTIEFLIRDAKQSAGLQSCQARDNKAIEFHWNASLTTVNFGRAMAKEQATDEEKKAFSMKSLKQKFFNENLLERFISKLELEQTLEKYEKVRTELSNYAVISP